MNLFLKDPLQLPFLCSRIRLACLFLLFSWFSAGQEILVPPYLQPGNAPDLKKEEKVLIWQTDGVSGEFKVGFSEDPAFKRFREASISFVDLNFNEKDSKLYRAHLKDLNFDTGYSYRVSLNDSIIAEHSFKTRSRKPQSRFAVFADVGAGSPEQAGIAYRVSLEEPQFAMILGDMAYNDGRAVEYRHRFFPVYMAPVASPTVGAPLLQSIPFYMLLGNHDVYSYDLDLFPDGLAYFYYSDLPRNAPVPNRVIEPTGNSGRVEEFKRNTSPRYPVISNYSFQHGNVHVIALDANAYINPLDPKLVEWIRSDLEKSKSDWKMVAFHHAAFNASPIHYNYQIMRLLSPLLEELGVDLVLSAHEHNYQRSLPLKFAPALNEAGTGYVVGEQGRVEGTIELDQDFDGKTNTMANGIIYVVTGAGGGALYDPQLTDNPELWQKETPESLKPYTTKLVSDRHSFTLIETNGKELSLKQIDAEGNVFDEIRITK